VETIDRVPDGLTEDTSVNEKRIFVSAADQDVVPGAAIALRRFSMKLRIRACLAGDALLAACSSNTGPGGGTSESRGRGAAGSEENLVQSAGDRIFFDTDASDVNARAQATLDRQARWLRQYLQVSVWVAGNCDERGTEEYNLALGQRRANADRDYLVAHGIAQDRIETISYGKSRPIDPASSPEAWAQNRNVITSVK
jgi:peptidoglycan-associated lipoprotein